MLSLLARFPLEIHAWTVPLTFVTGWVIGYVHFRNRLHRKHPDLYHQWFERVQGDSAPAEEPGEPEERP